MIKLNSGYKLRRLFFNNKNSYEKQKKIIIFLIFRLKYSKSF